MLQTSIPGADAQSAATRPTIGLALEGGGALGIAHIGVLKWMNEHHIPVDRIAGTSMGAFVGSLAASGHSPAEIETIATAGKFDDLFTLKPSLNQLSFRRRADRDELPQAISLGLRGGGVSTGNALIADERLNAFLSTQLLSYNSEQLNFDDLPIPFRCVATNLTSLSATVFSSGSLPFAVRSSISIPGVFPPVQKGEDFLVDGAIMDNLPTDVLRKNLHADVIISVYLGDSPFPSRDASSLVGVFARALQAATSRNVQLNRAQADVEISPNLDGFTATDYTKGTALVKLGYDAAESQRDKLLKYALSQTEWESYQAALLGRKRIAPNYIRVLRVDGPDATVSAKLQHEADKLVNRPFDAAKADGIVIQARGDGALDAYYETFHTTAASSPDPKQPALPDNGISLHWKRNLEGPPYLLLGADVRAMTSNVTSSLFDLRFIDQNLGGYGSELRSDARLGYFTQLGTEYYRPLGTSGLFFQPHLQLLREPVYLWVDQKRVSERLLQRAGGGLDLGVTLHRNFQAALEYRASTLHWSLRNGSDDSPTPHLSGMTESAAAHLVYSTRTADIASPSGTRVDLTVGHLFSTTASSDAPFLRLDARQSFTFAQKNLLSLSTEANTYFRNNVADPLRFTLGGPLQLYASSADEYRGTDTVLNRAIYLRRIATLPTGLGQGVYLTGGYEAGSIWSPEHPSFLRQDGFAGILLSTPLGAITVGGAVGDAGHRKAFFTFGRLF